MAVKVGNISGTSGIVIFNLYYSIYKILQDSSFRYPTCLSATEEEIADNDAMKQETDAFIQGVSISMPNLIKTRLRVMKYVTFTITDSETFAFEIFV